jgi:hypothetical protein
LAIISLPNNWQPRWYQRPAWDYLEAGGKHAELIYHRRAGKDEIALHRGAVAAFERVANYWHMLPEYSQARKAIWESTNPHTGKRRIDEAFPHEIRSRTREQEMAITFVNGSSWQVVGSDNYNSLVGSAPAGIVYSEWALANPSARAYLRPIIAENNGWQIFITTPRGRNHAYTTFKAAEKTLGAFAQKLSVIDTKVLTPERLEEEKRSYIAEFGDDYGQAMFEQEYLCSFDAAIMGAYYGSQIRSAEQEGRICRVEYDPSKPVHTAWDLGYSDDTSIWFYQVIAGEIHILKYYGANGRTMDDYIDYVKSQGYRYGTHWLPHDARAKTLASGGKSIQEMAWHAFGTSNVRIVPSLSLQDGIQAVRAMLPRAWFDKDLTEDGIEALAQYQRLWDDKRKAFMDRPRHDWTSHAADAIRMLAIAWKEEYSEKKQDITPKFWEQQTLEELWKSNPQGQKYRI